MKTHSHPAVTSKILNMTVIVSALGYFVDIYDLLLFSIVRVVSLKDLGVDDSQLMEAGVYILNMQMIGLLLGGLIWGVLGDKIGRISVLFGSILLYSVANIANGFVYSVDSYALLRFIAGIGLAGELGTAITLVNETMTKENRGYGTSLVAAFGLLGAVLANLIGGAVSWRTAYIIGGVMGLLLLVMRISIFESGMFHQAKEESVKRGDLLMFFNQKDRCIKYLSCILIGIPIWYVIGILITFSPELAKELQTTEPITAGKSVMFSYIGLAIGDIGSGLLSQWFRTRKKVILFFMFLTALFSVVYLKSSGLTPDMFYFICVLLGISVGYWAMFVTTASEHFGTNLRATATSTAPNFVRGAVVPLTLSFKYLAEGQSLVYSAAIVGTVSLLIAGVALYFLDETFGKNLNYVDR
ncbi:MAG: MFS transporter [Bdellovibrionales bacterium]